MLTIYAASTIRAGRVDPAVYDINSWQHLLNGPDWDRFIRFVEPKTRSGRVTLAISTAFYLSEGPKQLMVNLRVDDAGPFIEASDMSELPFA